MTMTDLELLYLLEEAGYEPTFENLSILKETNKELKDVDVKTSKPIGGTSISTIRDLDRKKSTHVPTTPNGDNDPRVPVRSIRPDQYPEYARFDAKHTKKGQNKPNNTIDDAFNNLPTRDRYGARDNKHSKSDGQIKEAFSDYELYQILEESGYKTTEKNLSILKEGLDSGKYCICEGSIIDKLRKRLTPEKEAKNEKQSTPVQNPQRTPMSREDIARRLAAAREGFLKPIDPKEEYSRISSKIK
jgi:hypothetical protein